MRRHSKQHPPAASRKKNTTRRLTRRPPRDGEDETHGKTSDETPEQDARRDATSRHEEQRTQETDGGYENAPTKARARGELTQSKLNQIAGQREPAGKQDETRQEEHQAHARKTNSPEQSNHCHLTKRRTHETHARNRNTSRRPRNHRRNRPHATHTHHRTRRHDKHATCRQHERQGSHPSIIHRR